MRYKPKNIAALQVALGGLPDTMRVTAASAKKATATTPITGAAGFGRSMRTV
jgi:hypothetical protein